MHISTKFIRKQLLMLKPIVSALSLEATRKWQDKLGDIMRYIRRREISLDFKNFQNFKAAWVTPNDLTRDGAILYLHGGGYTCGSLEYALGFGSVLATKTGMKVFCAAYRLAPENKYPAALEDALQAYKYMISEGIRADRIVLCGDSAGGGMMYSLCSILKEQNIPRPCGLIGISPWTDLTASGDSYNKNSKKDPSMTRELLSYFADSYTDDRTDPLVSPLFSDLSNTPPSLIFVGGDEIMADDSIKMHEKLLEAGCDSTLIVKEEMWHGYVIFCLKENRSDFTEINNFLKKILPYERKLRWMRLDNAAKIYPAARRRRWSNVFRLSAELKEPIDRAIMQSALDVTVRRFPSVSVRIRKGLFWYYLEEMPSAPNIQDEQCTPIAHMHFSQIKECALRVIVHKQRVAVEFFHAITDGNGGLVFLKTLVAEYILQKYGVRLESEFGVLDRLEEPCEEELEDSFQKHTADVAKSRSENTAYKLPGDIRDRNFSYVITMKADASLINKKAKEKGITITAYMCAAFMKAIMNIQKEMVKNPKRYKPAKVLIPVNLRPIFKSRSLRNFVLYVTPEINQKLGEWEFDEICQNVHHQMKLSITEKEMLSRITANINSERSPIIKIMPLFIKDIAMKIVYNIVGERKSSITLSNLGRVAMPLGANDYIDRMDFILGAQATTNYNCGMITYGDTLYLNILRKSDEPIFERELYNVLREEGVELTLESNTPSCGFKAMK